MLTRTIFNVYSIYHLLKVISCFPLISHKQKRTKFITITSVLSNDSYHSEFVFTFTYHQHKIVKYVLKLFRVLVQIFPKQKPIAKNKPFSENCFSRNEKISKSLIQTYSSYMSSFQEEKLHKMKIYVMPRHSIYWENPSEENLRGVNEAFIQSIIHTVYRDIAQTLFSYF